MLFKDLVSNAVGTCAVQTESFQIYDKMIIGHFFKGLITETKDDFFLMTVLSEAIRSFVAGDYGAIGEEWLVNENKEYEKLGYEFRIGAYEISEPYHYAFLLCGDKNKEIYMLSDTDAILLNKALNLVIKSLGEACDE